MLTSRHAGKINRGTLYRDSVLINNKLRTLSKLIAIWKVFPEYSENDVVVTLPDQFWNTLWGDLERISARLEKLGINNG